MATPNTTRSGFDDAFTRWNWSATSKRPVGGAHPAFDGWQATHVGERAVKMALRKTLFKYKLHQDQDLFDRAYAYIREYY